MKTGIPCFDYTEIGPKGQDKITFQFVTGERNIPASAKVTLGDTDPMTGEKVTDVTFFREYHLQRNREIYYNKKAVACQLTGKEKEERQAIRTQIEEEIREKYGYAPDRGTLKWLVNERMPKQYRLEIDSFRDDEGASLTERMPEFADKEAEKDFQAIENEGHTLDDFEETLSPIQRDVFNLLRMQSEGINVRGMGKQLAEKWHVDKSDISKTKQQIGKLLKRWMKE